jgi:DNA-binding winged helix-turn-helix (wHTH) protein
MNEVMNDQMIFLLENGVHFLPEERRIINESGAVVELSENSYRFLLLILNGEMDKQNIIEHVWSEQRGLVSDSSYYGQIYILRKALGLVGLPGTLIKTIPRKGVKYTGAVKQQTAKIQEVEIDVPDMEAIAALSQYAGVAQDVEREMTPDSLPVEPVSVVSLSAPHGSSTDKTSFITTAPEWYHSRRWNQLITVLAVIAVCWLTTLAFAIFYFTTH